MYTARSTKRKFGTIYKFSLISMNYINIYIVCNSTKLYFQSVLCLIGNTVNPKIKAVPLLKRVVRIVWNREINGMYVSHVTSLSRGGCIGC